MNSLPRPVVPNVHLSIRQLRAFSETYRTRNLTHAAQTLSLSQPAVSALIRQFEEALGVTLFERGSRSLRPTKAADEAIELVENILSECIDLQSRMRSRAESLACTLSFSCVPALSTTIVPRVLAEFQADMPHAQIRIIDQATPSLIAPVLADECEFSVSPYPCEPAGTESMPLIIDQVSVIFGPGSRFASMASVTWQDLISERIIGISTDLRLKEILKRQLSVVGSEFKPALNIFFIQTGLALAANGIGVVLGPAFLAKWSPDSSLLQARPINEPAIEQSLLVHFRQGHVLSKPAEHFLRLLRRNLLA